MREMTHGAHGPQPSWTPGIPPGPYPQYPAYPPAYAPGHTPGYTPYGPPAGQPPPGQPPAHQPPAGRPSNALAVGSVIFAFLFPPVGAVLGHLALGQIRRGLQRGRDLAMVGLTLSYTFVVLTVVGAAVWAATVGSPGDVTVANRPDGFAVPDPAHTQTAPTHPDLSGILLSRDELRDILKAPGLTETKSTPGKSGADKDAKADPPECAGAVAAGLNTVYDASGATGYTRAGYSDTGTATMVNQVAASFPTAADARSFVAQNAEQWRQCAGRSFTISSSTSPGLTWIIGTATVSGDRVTLPNTLTARHDLPEYRILAAKDDIVIDLSVLARQLDDEPAVIADRMLSRVGG